jgi:hypothetical protein
MAAQRREAERQARERARLAKEREKARQERHIQAQQRTAERLSGAADSHPADSAAPQATVHDLSSRGGREKLISQVPPRYAKGPIRDAG